MAGRIFAALLLLGLLALGWAWQIERWRLPPRWNPWLPLDVRDAPNWLTRYKLARLDEDGTLCRAALATAELRYRELPDRDTGPGCGFRDAIRIEASSLRPEAAFSLSCRSAVALALWERHVVQPAAHRHLGSPAVRLEHYGSYACRNVYGRSQGRRSAHATADALDVAGFGLADGRRVRVRQHWPGEDGPARFLHEVHRGACRFFDGVLGPGYNAAHRDHLHLERGGARVCR